MPKIPISGRLDKSVIDDCKKVAKMENRSFNNLLETALIEYCKTRLKE